MSTEFEHSVNHENEIVDPRRDLLERGQIERSDNFDYKEFEKGVCAQTFATTLSHEGELVCVPSGLFIPEDERRLEWEDAKKLEDDYPELFEKHVLAQETLSRVLETGRFDPDTDRQIQISGRLAFGTVYTSIHPESGERLLIVRFNNDPNNPFSGFANPCSSLTRTLPSKFHPGEQLRGNYSEIIPAGISSNGEIEPYIPTDFGGKTGGRARREYKGKVMAVSHQIFGTDLHQYFAALNQESIPTPRISGGIEKSFTTVPVENGITIQVQVPGRHDTVRQRNMLVSTTGTGAIECQRMVEIPLPNTLLDPEFGSRIAVIAETELTDYLEHVKRDPKGHSHYISNTKIPNPPVLRVERLVDGATGQDVVDAPELGFNIDSRTLDNFQISPPLKVIAEYLYRQREKNS